MSHRATARFWALYDELPADVRALADRSFELLKQDPRHPSLQLKQIRQVWSVRVGLSYRALAFAEGDDLVWYWIGTHATYDRLVRK